MKYGNVINFMKNKLYARYKNKFKFEKSYVQYRTFICYVNRLDQGPEP